MASQQFYDRVNEFCDKLKQRKIEASLDAAKGTAELMRQLVTSQRLPDPHSLLAEVKNVGLKIQAAKPIGEYEAPAAYAVPTLFRKDSLASLASACPAAVPDPLTVDTCLSLSSLQSYLLATLSDVSCTSSGRKWRRIVTSILTMNLKPCRRKRGLLGDYPKL